MMFPKVKSTTLLLFLLLFVFGACSQDKGKAKEKIPSPKKKEGISVGLISGLRGTLAPCGCTSKPLGGLSRLAQVLEERSELDELLVLGNSFSDPHDTMKASAKVKEQKDKLLLEFFQRLRSGVMVPGDTERRPSAEIYQGLAQSKNLLMLDGLRNDATLEAVSSTIRTYNDFKLGLIGVNDAADNLLSQLAHESVRLRAHGAGFIIVLDAGPYIDLASNVKELIGIDVLLRASTSDQASEKIVGQTLVLTIRPKGQHLGFLRIVPKSQGVWVYDDQGKTKKASLQKRISRLEKSVARLEEGEARNARQAKLEELQKELKGLKPSVPTSSYVQWNVRDIEHSIVEDKWVAEKLRAYNLSLCDLNAESFDAEYCVSDDDKSKYVGSAACKNCHPQAYEVYEKTKHAQAWATLEKAAKQCDFGCIGCHSVGFQQPGGYCRLEDAHTYKNVGCENCHGPGAGHVKSPFIRSGWSKGFGRHGNDPEVCTGCHNQEHSDLFDYSTYLEKILGPGHGKEIGPSK
ncbi:MAG: hypothetical protein CMH60_00620 [Myxococcales bacterium]|nr:hypothetical protein [Myxococcales bacterium]|tara:strand:- start:820 stop:2373 length:1554 start_codon:yes stop_codon:yes gene_type:complete